MHIPLLAALPCPGAAGARCAGQAGPAARRRPAAIRGATTRRPLRQAAAFLHTAFLTRSGTARCGVGDRPLRGPQAAHPAVCPSGWVQDVSAAPLSAADICCG